MRKFLSRPNGRVNLMGRHHPRTDPTARPMSPDEPSSLSDWIRRHAAGDPAAAEAVIRHAADRLRTLTAQHFPRYPAAARLVDASDVFQEAVVRMMEALRRRTFNSTCHFLGYAGCTIRHYLLDLCGKLRRERREPADPDRSDPLLNLPAGTDDPAALAEWTAFHEAVDALSPPHQELFHLLHYVGLTQAEAAELLGQPLRTLKTHWQQAKIAFVRVFGREPPG